MPPTCDAVAEGVAERGALGLLEASVEVLGVTVRVGLPLEHALGVLLRVTPSELLGEKDRSDDAETDGLAVELIVALCVRV